VWWHAGTPANYPAEGCGMARLPYTPAALVWLTDLSRRWTGSDLDKIIQLAEGFTRAIQAAEVTEGQIQLAEREYLRRQTTELSMDM
jgi:hypothetical protein